MRAVLEAYAATGVLGLARRDGNRRYYDLIERLLPPGIVARKIPLREQIRHKLLSRYRAHGLLGIGGADIFGGIGVAKPDPERPEHPGRTALREELVEQGELVPVSVEGVRGKRFVLREEVELLNAPPEPPLSVAFLPPFDPLVWDRGLLGSLFGFDYVWELFVPPAKRRWGWYVLPILFRDRLVGRIEPRIDRAERFCARAQPLVGGPLRPAPRRGLRRRDAGRAPRVPPLRQREPARVGTAPQHGTPTPPHAAIGNVVSAWVRLCEWSDNGVCSLVRRAVGYGLSKQAPTREGRWRPSSCSRRAPTGKFSFSLVATNGQVIATSEAYESKASAVNGIESVKRNAADAAIDDQTDK